MLRRDERSRPPVVVARLRNLHMLARMALRHAQDDPARLAVQVARRLPHRARTQLAGLLTTGPTRSAPTRDALGAFLADRPDEAREILLTRMQGGGLGRVAAELAVQVGLDPTEDAPSSVRARAAWRRGDLAGALRVLSEDESRAGRRLQHRLASERRTMMPGYRLTPPVHSPVARPAEQPRALHILTNSLPRTQSGYALRSHAILQSQQRNGIAVHAVTRIGYPVNVGLYRAPDVDEVEGVRYERLLPRVLAATPEARLEQTVAALLPRLMSFRPTVVHTTTHYPNAIVARALAEAVGVPWVYEVRGQLEKTWLASRPEAERPLAATSERYRLQHAKETEMAQAADHVVVLSEALRADLVARGVPHERISIVPNAVDETLLAACGTPAEGRRALGLPEEGFWVGTVSSLVGYEGLDLFVEAVAVLRHRGLDVRGAIVGDGVSRPGLQRLVTRLGLDDAVVLPGRVDRAAASAWHRALDVFVVPRRDVEVCRTVTPLKPIEAMAAGRPVVASDLPALAEIVTPPGSGLLAAPGDALALADTLAKLHDDEGLRVRLGAAGRSFAATRTWAAMAARYRQIYDGLGTGT